VEENKAVVVHYIEECWNRHDLGAIDDFVLSEYLNHAASAGNQGARARYSLRWQFSVFPDHHFDVEDAVTDRDLVTVQGTCSGPQEGELMNIAPTGERFAAQRSR
jgi:predicted ester cyclase